MKKLLLSAGLVAATIIISGAANAESGTPSKEKQLEAYRAYVAAQGTQPTEAGQAAIVAAPVTPVTATSVGATTTVEKTTTKTYEVSKRKVGLIGGRSFPTRKETVDGGEVKEVTVNGVETEKAVVKPDQMEGKAIDSNGGDYYAGRRGVQEYKEEAEKPNSNLDVHFTGRFNN